MAYTRQIGNRKEIGIRDDVFNSVEEAINYYNIVNTQFYQVKTFFNINEPHKVIMTCLNFGINEAIHRSVNLSKYLIFIKTRVSSLTELWIRSDLKALSDFLKMEESKKFQKKIVEEYSQQAIKEEPVMTKEQIPQPDVDFSSFNGSQDFNKIGMQFVLASNIKALKGFVDILQEVTFPIPADKVHQVHGDLEPIKKMIDDSLEITSKLIEEGKTY